MLFCAVRNILLQDVTQYYQEYYQEENKKVSFLIITLKIPLGFLCTPKKWSVPPKQNTKGTCTPKKKNAGECWP